MATESSGAGEEQKRKVEGRLGAEPPNRPYVAKLARVDYGHRMPDEPRLTVPVAKTLAALVSDPAGDHYGLELMKATGLPSGTLYPILARLERAGWVESRWEDVDPVQARRPARRYHRLTADGAVEARARLARLHEQTRPVMTPRWT